MSLPPSGCPSALPQPLFLLILALFALPRQPRLPTPTVRTLPSLATPYEQDDAADCCFRGTGIYLLAFRTFLVASIFLSQLMAWRQFRQSLRSHRLGWNPESFDSIFLDIPAQNGLIFMASLFLRHSL